MISKTIEYLLLTTSFIEKEWTNFMKLIYNVTLVRARVCRTTPNKIKFGLIDMIELGFKNIFIMQGVEKLALFLEERNRGNIASKLL